MGRRPGSKRWRRLERWQVLLAAAVAAVASIIVALVSSSNGQSSGPPSLTLRSSESSPSLPIVAITGLSEQPSSPPPSRQYTWNGIERNLPSDASVFVVGTRSGTTAAVPQASATGQSYLVSPQALISKNGTWTITWIIPNPPSAVMWSAVAQIPSESAVPCTGPAPCAGQSLSEPPYQLSSQGPNAPGVVATATYQP